MPLAMQVRERRFHPRVSCKIPDIEAQFIRNMSQSGAYMESHKRYQAHEALPLTFLLPPETTPMHVNVKITRRESLSNGGFGYGLCFKDLSPDYFKQIQYFVLYRVSQDSESSIRAPHQGVRFLYKQISIETKQENLTDLDRRLRPFVQANDFFYVHDLTKELEDFVHSSGIQEGNILVQSLHTSAALSVNELDEPMLLADLAKKLRDFAPKEDQYLHNGPLRTMNLCAEDSHCDRNGDAHVKAALFGHPSVTLIIRNGKLVLGQWQRVAFLEFDGPRNREIIVQAVGE